MELEVREVSDADDLKLRLLRAQHSKGHSEGCQCKPCVGLRSGLAKKGVLPLVYSYPLRSMVQGGVGTACEHGVLLVEDCKRCGA